MLPPSEPTSVAPRPGRSSTACVPDASSSEPGRRMTWRSMGRVGVSTSASQFSACRRSRWRCRPAPCHSAGPWRRSPHGCGRRCPAPPARRSRPNGIGLGHIGLLAPTRLLDGNAAAPGIEPAQHGDLVGAPDLDRAAGIDADARALAHHDGAALRGPVRAQRQARCVSVPRSASSVYSAGVQRVRRRRAGRRTGRLRGAALQPQHRHEHVDLRAVRDGQALVAVDLVLAEAGAEQRRVQPQRGGVLRIQGRPARSCRRWPRTACRRP